MSIEKIARRAWTKPRWDGMFVIGPFICRPAGALLTYGLFIFY